MSGQVSLNGLFLGPTGSVATFNESSLPTGLKGQLGKVVETGGKKYRLVLFDNGTSNVASAAGKACYWKSKADWTVTSDESDSEAGVNGVAGAFLGVLTDGYYGFIQCGGDQTGVYVAGSTGIGDTLIGGTTDGQLERMPASNATYDGVPVAVALSAVNANTSTVRWLPAILA